MNETSNLETQLRSWAPRRPSRKISQALFGLPTPRRQPSTSTSRAWLVPASAAMLLMLTLFNHRTGASFERAAGADSSIVPGLNRDTRSVVNSSLSRTIVYRSQIEATNRRGELPPLIPLSYSRATNN